MRKKYVQIEEMTTAAGKYHGTTTGLINWAISELEHVGRIASIEDENVQYSYAMSTLNGMAHLKDAIFEYITDHPDNHMNGDLLVFHEKVIRVMKHLIKVYSLDISAIEAFNTRGILSKLNYLKNSKGKSRKSRKSRKNHSV